jgi:hypothetical protein
MGNADDVDPAFPHEIKDDVRSLRIAVVAFLDLRTGLAKIGIFRQPGKPPVDGQQISIALLPSSSLQRIAGNVS